MGSVENINLIYHIVFILSVQYSMYIVILPVQYSMYIVIDR